MLKVVVTGANGFIGKNLCASLQFSSNVCLERISREDTGEKIAQKIADSDILFHLAGVNRPTDPKSFLLDNEQFTYKILDRIEKNNKPCKIIFSSSSQAVLDNPYGKSKLNAEEYASQWVKNTPHELNIYRLPGVFGKWCRPNYNSVVATFCYNVAYNLSLEIRDNNYELHLVYIDDVVQSFITHVKNKNIAAGKTIFESIDTVYQITLGKLSETILSFKESRNTLQIPAVDNALQKALYSTYLSYLPKDQFAYPMQVKTDERGTLFEWVKQIGFGQIFISTTKPGITRGNHFHHTKTEKFLVIQGEATIKFRHIDGDEIIEYKVSGQTPRVLDIPPGYTHNITNIGSENLITLFWANEIFDPAIPDTQFLKVDKEA